ncbi:hypothetical protein AAG747_18835 [Rapidithrix thailandica]|uniref:Uncharacterized protein n=1 Tax=Rapidithrix thailandica TaxID=413964 RepID=A0AAW9RYL0_9BACT
MPEESFLPIPGFLPEKNGWEGQASSLAFPEHVLTEADRVLLRENTVSKNKPEPVSKAIGETLYSNLQ